MKDPSDLQIDRLLRMLDAIARDFDRDYGLPIFDVPDDPAEPIPGMRDAVRRWLRAMEAVQALPGGPADEPR